MAPIDPAGPLDYPEDEFDEDGTWICPECRNEGTPGGCALCRLLDGSD